MLKKWAPLVLSLTIAVILAVLAITPPAPKGIDTHADEFSSGRAMKDVRIIAAKPHPTGSEENRIVREYLLKRLDALGADTKIESSALNARALKRLNLWSGRNLSEQALFNVIGIFPGTDRSKPALLLMAHHDTVWDSPGAADDTIGIAAILEIARATKDTPQSRDLILLFTDAEELGLNGAKDFFANSPLKDKIGAVINFEARGGGGTANLFQTSRNNGNAAKLFAKSVKEPSASSLSTFVYNILPNDTDLTPALKKEYAAYNIANIGRAEYYHSPKINSDTLDEATLQHMGSQGLDLTRALLAADTIPARKTDATFFDLFGFFTIVYPAILGWLFIAISGVSYIAAINSKDPKTDLLSGALRMVGFLFIGGALLYGLNFLSGSDKGSNYYDRLAAISQLEILVGFFCFGAFAIFFGKSFSDNQRIGAALPLFVMALFGQAFAPTATYFLGLTIMLCGVTALVNQKRAKTNLGLGITVVSAALISGYMIMLGHLLMQGVGPDLLSVAILPAALAALAILPLYSGLSKSIRRYIGLAGCIFAIAIALWIRLDPIASTVPTY